MESKFFVIVVSSKIRFWFYYNSSSHPNQSTKMPRDTYLLYGRCPLCSFFVLFKPQAWHVITRSVYVIAVGAWHHRRCISCGLMPYIHSGWLHTRLRRITSTLRVIGTRWEFAHVSREQNYSVFSSKQLDILLILWIFHLVLHILILSL